MSTKVKGEAIKEGSIPLSALSTEVKNKIENAGAGGGGATPDWNAQAGKAGYIENKPFDIIKSNKSEITNINHYFIRTDSGFYPIEDLYIKYNNKIALLAKEKQTLYWGEGIDKEMDGAMFYLGDDGETNITVGTSDDVEFELIIALSSEFIPDTVIKTTPQTLSDTAKNQARANLGISNPDWNAQEGEAGYIKNKTHCSYLFEQSVLYDDNSNSPTISFYIDISNAIISKDALFGMALIVNVSTSLGETSFAISKEQYMEMEAGNRVLITTNFPDETIDLYVSYDEYFDSFKREAIISIDGAVYGTYKLCCTLVKQLESGYIPDTVIKTKPQELSNNDKNQALANLGIDEYIKNFNKKFYLDIAYDEITLDETLVVDYPGGVTNLVDYIKTFIANCVCYNQIGFTIRSKAKLACVYARTNENAMDASLDNISISDYKNSITQFDLIFGIYDYEGEWISSMIQFSFDSNELYYYLREV